jgi:tetratricopeptide (TPR) repeat protein
MTSEGPSFAELLRRHREAAGLSQQALAVRSGLSEDAIGLLERGRRQRPRRDTVRRLSVALRLGTADRAELEDLAEASRMAQPRGLWARARPPAPSAGIPPDPIVHFVGRDAELERLASLLRESGRVAIHGLGGVGKTQLTAQFVHVHRGRYPDGVFWLRADEETSLASDLASLTWRLGLPEREELDQERQVEAALRWLREHPAWLLVLDNLEPAVAAAVEQWLPSGLPGHVLASSRTPAWSVRLRLEPLSPEGATRLLMERTGQTDDRSAGGIAEMLGRLPLALVQAAAYLVASGRDLAGYAALLGTRPLELLAEGEPEAYPRTVATTWQVSFERLERDHPPAVGLLRLCAFLAPDDIPLSVLQAGAPVLPADVGAALSDGIEVDRATTALQRYSLMDRQGDTLRVHRLVQTVVRESLPVDRREHWLAAAIRLLLAAFPERPHDDPGHWALCARLLAHVQAVDRLAADGTVEPRALSAILCRAGIYLDARGQFALAAPPIERALALSERTLGPDHADVVEALEWLAVVYLNQGRPTEARPLAERGLAIQERTLGPDHPDLVWGLNSLGSVLMELDEQGRARAVVERACAISLRLPVPDDIRTAASLNNMALALQANGELAAARADLERSLRICERLLGPDNPHTANVLNNLGWVLREQGDLAAAASLLRRALAIKERVLGPDHRRTAESLNNLAVVLGERGEPAKARPLSERALRVRERALGPDHPHTATSLHDLAVLLRRLGEQRTAVGLLERALDIRERVLGPDHRETVRTRHELRDVRRSPTRRRGVGSAR